MSDEQDLQEQLKQELAVIRQCMRQLDKLPTAGDRSRVIAYLGSRTNTAEETAVAGDEQ